MFDKNGKEIKTGDIVNISGAYFKLAGSEISILIGHMPLPGSRRLYQTFFAGDCRSV